MKIKPEYECPNVCIKNAKTNVCTIRVTMNRK